MNFRMALTVLILTQFLMIVNFSWASNSAGQRIRYDDLKQLVLEKNENVESAKLHMKAQKDRTGRLVRSFLPQISATVGQEQFKTGSVKTENQEYWRLEASVNLYKGGRDHLEDKIRDSQLTLSQTFLSLEYQKELKEARLAYWKIIGLSIQI
ncbi:MAG: TolC family protein [Bdellovibrionales bacterium]